MRLMYTTYLATVLTLVLNWVALLMTWLVNDNEDGSGFIWASIYMVTGIYGGWKFWYRKIYRSTETFATRSSIRWWIFKLFFGAHIAFCGIGAAGIPKWGMVGFIT